MILCNILDSLQPFASKITSTVNVGFILLPMIQEGLLTPHQQQYLSSVCHTASEKQQKLCSIVLELPESCVDKFINCLSETSDYEPHKQLYDELHKFRHAYS